MHHSGTRRNERSNLRHLPFNAPRKLPGCPHVFCQRCIFNEERNPRFEQCPVCRVPTSNRMELDVPSVKRYCSIEKKVLERDVEHCCGIKTEYSHIKTTYSAKIVLSTPSGAYVMFPDPPPCKCCDINDGRAVFLAPDKGYFHILPQKYGHTTLWPLLKNYYVAECHKMFEPE